jgi:signal transduction histidine kinase
MGAARVLPPVLAGDSPLADDASRQREVDRLRATLDALRNPAGAVRLAVQMLAGPLRAAMEGASAEQAASVADVLGALETATAELTQLLAPLGAERPVGELIALPNAPLGVEAIVAGVRQTVSQRVRLPATVESIVEPGLRPDVDAKDLQAALVGLVQNAIESMARRRPNGAPWMVELRVTLEPSGQGTHAVVFDVRDRGDGLPPSIMRWLGDATGLAPDAADGGPGMSLQLARRVAEGAGGRLLASRVGGTTRVRLCVPQR